MGQLVDRVKFEEGKHAYQANMNLADLMDRVNREQDDTLQAAEWDAQEKAKASFALGFVQGVLDDLRMVANRC